MAALLCLMAFFCRHFSADIDHTAGYHGAIARRQAEIVAIPTFFTFRQAKPIAACRAAARAACNQRLAGLEIARQIV
jgi:hypothetical protein